MKGPWAAISRTRVVLGAAGVLLAAFGVFRLVTEIPPQNLIALVVWLGSALVLHDVVLSPAIVGLGVLLRRVPARARTYLQGALIAGGSVTVIAVPMIYRTGSQPRVKAILNQNYWVNLFVLFVVILAVALLTYLLRTARERWVDRNGRPTAGRASRPRGGVRPE